MSVLKSKRGESSVQFIETTRQLEAHSVKKVGGTASWWWLRSPCALNSFYFCAVNTDGSVSNNYAGYSSGVCFGFCF